MLRIPLDQRGRLTAKPGNLPAGPLLLFGPGLLAADAAAGLRQTLEALNRPAILATDYLQECAPGGLAALAQGGIQAIEVPLPTADGHRLDELAGTPDVLQDAVHASLACYRAALPLWVRVPLGEYNRSELGALAHLLTRDLLSVERVLFHCAPSLGKPHKTAPKTPYRRSTDPLVGFAERLYSLALELESAKIRTAVEHRDGFPLCLFHPEPDPLRFFRDPPDLPAPGTSEAAWAYPLEAPAERLVKPDPCGGCALEHRCRGLHRNLVHCRGLALPVPFAHGAPERLLGKPAHAVYQGAPRRLRGHSAYEKFWPPSEDTPSPAAGHRLAISPNSVIAAGLDRVRLDGARVILARLPALEPAEELITPPLAFNNLVPPLRAAGATVEPVDFHVLAQRDAQLAPLVDPEPERRTDRDMEVAAPSPDTSHRLQRLAQGLLGSCSGGADLLGLSVSVPSALPAAQAVTTEWKRQGGGATVVGGHGMVRPERLLELCPDLDYVIHGEGEIPLLLLADALRGGRPLGDVPGLVYRDPTGSVVANHAVVHDLDIHPVPDVSGLDLDAYDGVAELGADHPVFLYQFIRGCHQSCAFCGEFERWRFRARNPGQVVRDLRFITEELNRHHVFFVNNMINVTRRYLDAWLDAMQDARLELHWSDCCRPSGLHADQLRRLASVGCRSLTWGLDILSPSLNKRLWKNLSLPRAVDLLTEAHAVGIKNSVNVIVGLPNETEADLQLTIDFLLRHAALCDRVSVMVYNFRKDSPLGMWPARFGLVPTEHGVSEVDGRDWPVLRELAEQKAQRVNEAIAQAVRTGS